MCGEQPQLEANPVTPLVVVVRVTTQCSLACQFCGFSRELQRPIRQIETGVVRQLGQVLREFRHRTGRDVLVSWLGGEPFQWRDWSTVSKQFVEEFGLELSVTTNGLALQNDRTRAEALERFRQITLSVDGLAEHHDAVRQQPGMFQRLKTTILKLVQQRDSNRNLLRVNTVLMRSNVESFRTFALAVADWGVDELTFNPLGGNDRPEFFPANRLTLEQLQRFRADLDQTRAMAAERGLKICGTPAYLDRLEATASGLRLAIAECYPGQHFLFVDETGRLSPCSFTVGEFSPRLEPGQTMGVSQWVAAFAQQRRRNCPSACQDCHANHVYAKFR